jgi:hypothetical protein
MAVLEYFYNLFLVGVPYDGGLVVVGNLFFLLTLLLDSHFELFLLFILFLSIFLLYPLGLISLVDRVEHAVNFFTTDVFHLVS